jgi:hypothetical protein
MAGRLRDGCRRRVRLGAAFATLLRVRTESSTTDAIVVRRMARIIAVIPAVLVLVASGAAMAEPPENWEVAPTVGALDALLVIVGLPLLLFALITLLVYVPSMVRGEKYTPGLAWRNQSEWFGGPQKGVEAVDTTAPPTAGTQKGGVSARW